MKYFDTFTGIGGFTLAINKAYEKLCIENKKQGLQGVGDSEGQCSQLDNLCADGLTCIGYSEIDKYASSIYQKHYPEHKNYGDITKINAEELPDFDLLVGGFPCQAFSIAGKRGGFEDTRGTLFFDLARILRTKKPRLFVFENVKGLLSHDKGNTFKTIISTLDELGYDTQWQVLNSKNFGVPQNRERVFIVGHLRETSRPEVFPFGKSHEEDTQCGVNTGTLTGRYPASQREGTYIEEDGYRIREATKKGYAIAVEGDSINLSVPNSSTRRGRVGKGIAQTIDTGMQQYTIQPTMNIDSGIDWSTIPEGMRIRRLTPTECERLQGFPDGWTEGVSDTQRYKCCGNAVTVNVVQAIMEKLLNPK